MSREAWGRWGPDDEVGAVNQIGPEQCLDAIKLVREGRVISLVQPLGPDTPVASHRLGFGHFMDRSGSDYAVGARRPGGFQFAEDTVLLPTHAGTHLDALCHVWYEDLLYNGHPGGAIRTSTGAQRCGVATIPPIVTRGLLFDLVGPADRRWSAGERVTREQLQAAGERAGVEPRAGDVVLIRTGWCERVNELGDAFFDGEPGLNVDAAEWLASLGVSVIGVDNYAIEAIPFDEGNVFPVHQRLLRDFGIPLLEGVLLAGLAAAKRPEFLLCALPLPLVGATASPLHPVAVL
jgi:kynurenine formamidase